MLGRPEGDVGTVYDDELQPPQDVREVFRGKLGRVHADRSPGLLRNHGEALGRCGPASTLTGAPGPPQELHCGESSGRCGLTSTMTGTLSHLRTRGELSGNCGPASMLTGAPEQPQDLRGGFRKMWCHVHSSRSSQAPQDIS